jgi:hypothetical protein
VLSASEECGVATTVEENVRWMSLEVIGLATELNARGVGIETIRNPRNYTLTIPRSSAEQFVDDAKCTLRSQTNR